MKRFTTHQHWGSRLAVAVLVLSFLVVTLGAAQAQPVRGKLDKVVREGLAVARGDTRIRVIVTVAPNARRGLLARLRAHGVDVSHDFTLIPAMSAKLPAGLIRQLEKDKDVVAISYDDDVTSSGISSTVTGTALGGNYSLRSTLGLTAPGAAVTRTFQQGNANGYASTVDGGVQSGAPTTNYATAGFIQLSATTSGRMLIRFDNLFGSGSSQIPYGSGSRPPRSRSINRARA